MKELTSTSFGYLIAFLLPGLFGLYALSFWVPQVGVLLQPVLTATATVGPSAVLLVVAVGMGLCISAARHFFLVKLVYEQLLKQAKIPDNLYKSLTSDKLALHRALAEEHYRYHQFYGGCAVALLILFIGWLVHGHFKWSLELLYAAVGFTGAELLLERSANDCHGQYVGKCNAMVAEANTEKEDLK